MDLTMNELISRIKEWLEEKKAERVKVYDVREKSDYTDMIIVCEGSGALHNRAIAENVLEQAKSNSIYVLGKEGFDSGTWILIDLVTVIIHIFDKETREYYDIEKLWQVSDRIRKQQLSSEQIKKED